MFALGGRESAPDAVWFRDCEGVRATRFQDRTGVTDGFGLGFPPGPRGAALVLGREELGTVAPAACRQSLPVPVLRARVRETSCVGHRYLHCFSIAWATTQALLPRQVYGLFVQYRVGTPPRQARGLDGRTLPSWRTFPCSAANGDFPNEVGSPRASSCRSGRCPRFLCRWNAPARDRAYRRRMRWPSRRSSVRAGISARVPVAGWSCSDLDGATRECSVNGLALHSWALR